MRIGIAIPHQLYLDQFLHRLTCPKGKIQIELIVRLVMDDPLKRVFLLRAKRALVTLAATSLFGLQGFRAFRFIFWQPAEYRVAMNTQ